MDTIKDRYHNDPTFRQIVDVIRHMIHQHQTTPSELREALLLAAYMAEMENPTPRLYRLEGYANELLADVRRSEARHHHAQGVPATHEHHRRNPRNSSG